MVTSVRSPIHIKSLLKWAQILRYPFSKKIMHTADDSILSSNWKEGIKQFMDG